MEDDPIEAAEEEDPIVEECIRDALAPYRAFKPLPAHHRSALPRIHPGPAPRPTG
jgi:hypothetical protein